MKKEIILPIIILLLFAGCSKDNTNTQDLLTSNSPFQHPRHFTKHGFNNDTFSYYDNFNKNINDFNRNMEASHRYNQLREELAPEKQ